MTTPRTDAASFVGYRSYCGGIGSHMVEADFARQLEVELDAATMGRCTCSGCGKTVNNAWRNSDGHWCLTCLAEQVEEAESHNLYTVEESLRASRAITAAEGGDPTHSFASPRDRIWWLEAQKEVARLRTELAIANQQLDDHAEDWAMCGISHDSLLARALVLSDRAHKAEAALRTTLPQPSP